HRRRACRGLRRRGATPAERRDPQRERPSGIHHPRAQGSDANAEAGIARDAADPARGKTDVSRLHARLTPAQRGPVRATPIRELPSTFMAAWLFGSERVEFVLMWTTIELAALMIALVAGERLIYALSEARRRRIEQRYAPLIERAMNGDDAAVPMLAATPHRHRIAVARLLLMPLIVD